MDTLKITMEVKNLTLISSNEKNKDLIKTI